MTNAPFLPLAELFGSRDQFWDISQTIVPVKLIDGDALANGALVGADATSALTAAAADGSASVTSLHDCYLTALFVREPRQTVINNCFVWDIGHYRNLGGQLTQISYLRLAAPTGVLNNTSIGIAATVQRTYPVDGIPYGTLIRAGDIFSINFRNTDTVAFVTGCTIGYRGFQGPPA